MSEPAPADIVVTASKQRVPLLRYPGSLTIVPGTGRRSNAGFADVSDLAGQLPILQSTQLGPGRNKVFIRGIADSSFNGTTQSTASVYLDDVQLNASGPDPALRLYDMQSIEVLEGPQGTLYGAGAIGGVLRLTSNAPVLDGVASGMTGGVTLTQGGAPGGDLAGMINLPLVAGQAGVRAVAYAARDGGYIDDARRRLRNVNRVDTLGGRLALRADPGHGWRMDVGAAAQRIAVADGQYTRRGAPDLTRRSDAAQPFRGRFLFGRVTLSKDWDNGVRLVSATGVADYHAADTFDATQAAGPAIRGPVLYQVDNDKLLVSQEVRLSQSLAGGRSWLAGISLLSDRSILSRAFRAAEAAIDVVGVSNVTRSASAFAEATTPLVHDLSLTLGGRATTARVDGEPSATNRPGAFIKGRSTQRFDPTVALSYRLGGGIAAFARYQTGFRTGGLAVAQGVGRVANYRPDSIQFGEIGIRRLRSGATGLGFAVSASAAGWNGIQADLLNRRGQPYTTNLGDARIQTVEATLDWVPAERWSIEGAMLWTHNIVYGPIADLSKLNNRRLPDTPPFAGHATVTYSWPERPVTPRIAASLDYVGRSVLGTGDLLDVSQGNYATIAVTAGVRWRNLDLTIGLENLTDATVNRFAFGNPFDLPQRDQLTPLRPRNVRIGVSAGW